VIPRDIVDHERPYTHEKPRQGLLGGVKRAASLLSEIKHDGYRLMARRDPIGIRLLTRNGHDWALNPASGGGNRGRHPARSPAGGVDRDCLRHEVRGPRRGSLAGFVRPEHVDTTSILRGADGISHFSSALAQGLFTASRGVAGRLMFDLGI
jgi:hypothetical protein